MKHLYLLYYIAYCVCNIISDQHSNVKHLISRVIWSYSYGAAGVSNTMLRLANNASSGKITVTERQFSAHLSGVSDRLAGIGNIYTITVSRYSRKLQRRNKQLNIFTEGQNSAHCGRHVYNNLLSQTASQRTLIPYLISPRVLLFRLKEPLPVASLGKVHLFILTYIIKF